MIDSVFFFIGGPGDAKRKTRSALDGCYTVFILHVQHSREVLLASDRCDTVLKLDAKHCREVLQSYCKCCASSTSMCSLFCSALLTVELRGQLSWYSGRSRYLHAPWHSSKAGGMLPEILILTFVA